MGTLFIDRKNVHVKLDSNALAFYDNGIRMGMVPIAPLKRVVVTGSITLETSVLNKLADEQIAVIFLSGKRLRFHGMLHGRLHNNGMLRLKQYEKCLSDFSLGYAVGIVRRKVGAQKELLISAIPQRPDVRFQLTSAVNVLGGIADSLEIFNDDIKTEDQMNSPLEILNSKLSSLRGYEGAAASAYFSAYSALFPDSLEFHNRNRRPPRDPVNSMLSLCYTMIHFESVREIETIGLDPTIGFYHQFEYGRESLACDLVELFRPIVDEFVWSLFRDREFTTKDFLRESDKPGCYLKKSGRQKFYPIYESWAKTIRPKLSEEVRALARNIAGDSIDMKEFIPEDEHDEQRVSD